MSWISANLLVLVFSFTFAAAATAQTPPIAVRGVPLGATIDQWKERFPTSVCSNDGCIADPTVHAMKTCPRSIMLEKSARDYDDCQRAARDELKFGTALPGFYDASFQNGRLARVLIVIDEDDAADVIMALAEKYGKPSSSKVAMAQNRAGARFENRIATWNRKDGRIHVEQRYSSIDRGAVLMTTKSYDADSANARAAKAKAAAKSL